MTAPTWQTVILNAEQVSGVLVPDGNGGERPARILALDLATKQPGWCAAEGHDYLASGDKQFAGKRAKDRMTAISLWLRALMDEWCPDWVAIEEPMGDHGNRHTDRWLGIVVGVAMECAWRAGAEVYLIQPRFVKQTGISKGNTRIAAAWLGKEKVSGDEADAAGLWQATTVPAWRGKPMR